MANVETQRGSVAAKSILYRKALAVCALSIAATVASAGSSDKCPETRDFSEAFSLDGIRDISIEAGAGKLAVVGRPGLTAVRVEAVACAESERDLEKIRLESGRDGATLVLQAVLPTHAKLLFGRERPKLDLEIQVPSAFAIRIVDSSGSLAVQGVESVEIYDDSGSILVQDVPGLVHVLQDGSGSITVERAGSVRIDEDGSGSITASAIAEDVYVGRDGSGSISADTVGGSFTVVSDSSGSVRHSNVVGAVRIEE